jgi:BASS family bile acid:Na+ symporter
MRILRFLKDWTLPTAMLTGTLLYLIFAFVPDLNDAAIFFKPLFARILPVILFLVLFVTFCKVDFSKMRPVGWHFWIGVSQILLVAMLLTFVLFFHLQGEKLILAEAVMVSVIGPCAAAAPVVTSKLGGNLESMTTYTFISNLLTAILIPSVFPLLNPAADISFLSAFAEILYRVCIVLLVPMLLAYVVKHFFHRFHLWIVGIKDLSFYLWAFCLTIVTGTTVKNIVHADSSVDFILLIAVSSLILCVIQFAIGRFVGRHFGSTIESGQALGQKNTAFAIWISNVYLNPLSSVGPGCYILWQNIINSLELWQHRKKD